MANAKKKPKPLKPLNRCDNKFVQWMVMNNLELPGNYAVNPSLYKDDPLYVAWKAAWSSAYPSGIMNGQKQGRKQIEVINKKHRSPMSYYEMADLFEGCKNGREYGLKIERWHGIFPNEQDEALDDWHVNQFGHKV